MLIQTGNSTKANSTSASPSARMSVAMAARSHWRSGGRTARRAASRSSSLALPLLRSRSHRPGAVRRTSCRAGRSGGAHARSDRWGTFKQEAHAMLTTKSARPLPCWRGRRQARQATDRSRPCSPPCAVHAIFGRVSERSRTRMRGSCPAPPAGGMPSSSRVPVRPLGGFPMTSMRP